MVEILAVDDEMNILKSLRRLLSKNYTVHCASNGPEALKVLEKQSIAVVISDYRMPDMDGIKFLTLVRNQYPETIRVMLTGYYDSAIAINSINEGHVYRFINKPWDNHELESLVQQAIELYNLRRERRNLLARLEEKNSQLMDWNQKLEQKVEERTNQLLQAERMATLGKLSGHIGHEIKNVLSILKGRYDLLDYTNCLPENDKITEDFFGAVKNSINRLSMFAENLQSIGKPKTLSLCNVDIITVIKESLKNLAAMGILKHYSLSEKYLIQSAVVRGDANYLEQIFFNLFINAHHAMQDKGEIDIVVKLSEGDKNIKISISDTGCGISKEKLNKIFEPFFTTKPDDQGTGLGLVVVKQITEAHKGSIKVESVESKGTKVTICFPANKN